VATATWTTEQARLYQLACVGLHGRPYASGDEGIASCFRDLGSVQLDPLPILGRNHDLVAQSRVPGTHPGDLLRLIHARRLGFEYWDKKLCAIRIDDYPLFRSLMERSGDAWIERRAVQLEATLPGTMAAVENAVRDHGPVSSRELGTLGVAQQEHRGWKATRAANVALDALWNRGILSVAHRESFRRYFDLTDRIIPEDLRASPPPPRDAFLRAVMVRRVGSVGLLAARGNPDAWALLAAARREKIPQQLVHEGLLSEIRVDGARTPYYAAAEARARLDAAQAVDPDRRIRCIAPLDPLLWGRDTLLDLWHFEYVWEVYKPAPKRRYGYYVLPLLQGTRLVARFDGRYDKREGVLSVLSYVSETGGPALEDAAVHDMLQRLLAYLGGAEIHLPGGGVWIRDSAAPDTS
jgi:uncharacterized protein YcaQ